MKPLTITNEERCIIAGPTERAIIRDKSVATKHRATKTILPSKIAWEVALKMYGEFRNKHRHRKHKSLDDVGLN